MTDVEERRQKLLRETRRIYSDKNSPPAVHPRYQSAYRTLYETDGDELSNTRGTFLIRIVIAVLLFAVVAVMDVRNETIGTVDSGSIISYIQQSLFGE